MNPEAAQWHAQWVQVEVRVWCLPAGAFPSTTFADPRSFVTERFNQKVVSRRTVTRMAVGLGGSAALTASVAQGQACERAVNLAALSDLALVGTILEVQYPTENDAAFLVRLPQNAAGGVGEDRSIVGFLRACPHMGCAVATTQQDQKILAKCPCHRSCFDLNSGGLQLFGRASQNLLQIRLELRAGRVFGVGLAGTPFGKPLTGRAP
jgi:arsenite oxidase small subunit